MLPVRCEIATLKIADDESKEMRVSFSVIVFRNCKRVSAMLAVVVATAVGYTPASKGDVVDESHAVATARFNAASSLTRESTPVADRTTVRCYVAGPRESRMCVRAPIAVSDNARRPK